MAVEHPLPPLRAGIPRGRAGERTSSSSSRVPRRRALLSMTCVAAASVAGGLALLAPAATTDADLARLLRAMGAIKAVMAVAASALVYWRLAWPASGALTMAYTAGSALTIGAATLILLLAFIPAGAVMFHIGGAILLIAAFRDGGPRLWPDTRTPRDE